ncbi:hypothetical protein NKH70_26770 [Mesorhizobium sp. M0991]|uniref:ribonuclease toxin HepT-like protein n=1 Tax=Mesorhizobium sp. M0991 TaxID=2957043 RepID=UPI00333D6E66
MSAEIAGIRPAVLDPELYQSLSELKGFRQLVRHRYGFDLKTDKVQENLDRVKEAFPSFVKAIVYLESTLTQETRMTVMAAATAQEAGHLVVPEPNGSVVCAGRDSVGVDP